MEQVRIWLPKVIIESLLIAFSILAALAVDEWREERQTRKRVAQTLESFAVELQENQRNLEKLTVYHERVQKEIGRLNREGAFQKASDLGKIPDFHGFTPPRPKDAAWRTALGTGGLAELDFETASLLSSVYIYQENLVELGRSLLSLLQPQNLLEANVPTTSMVLYEYLNDITINERGLLEVYRQVLKHLEKKKAAVG